jgi:hypothetical protein
MTVKNHRAPWSQEEVAQLETMTRAQADFKEIAGRLRRTEKAIEAKFYALNPKGIGPKAGKRQERRSKGASFFLS